MHRIPQPTSIDCRPTVAGGWCSGKKERPPPPRPQGRGGGGHGKLDTWRSAKKQPDDHARLTKDYQRHDHTENVDVDPLVGCAALAGEPVQHVNAQVENVVNQNTLPSATVRLTLTLVGPALPGAAGWRPTAWRRRRRTTLRPRRSASRALSRASNRRPRRRCPSCR